MFFVLLHHISAVSKASNFNNYTGKFNNSLSEVQTFNEDFSKYVKAGEISTFFLNKEGMSIVMVNWANAVLKISLNFKNYAFTVDDGYTMFTFKDSVTITIDNLKGNTIATFYGFIPPRYNSPAGYTCLVSNKDKWTITQNLNTPSSLLFDMFFKYKITEGEIRLSNGGDIWTYYRNWNVDWNTNNQVSSFSGTKEIYDAFEIVNIDASQRITNTQFTLGTSGNEWGGASIPFTKSLNIPGPYNPSTSNPWDDNWAYGDSDDKKKQINTFTEASTTDKKFVVYYYKGDFKDDKVRIVQGAQDLQYGNCQNEVCSAEYSTLSPLSLKISVSNGVCAEKVLFSAKPTSDKTFDLRTDFPSGCGTSTGGATPTPSDPSPSPSEKSNKGAIIAVAVVVPVVVLAGVGVGIFFFLQNKKNGAVNEEVNPSV